MTTMKSVWLLVVAVVAAVAIAVAVPVLATSLLSPGQGAPAFQQGSPAPCLGNVTPPLPRKWPGKWWPRGGWRVEVSSEFESKVLSILRSDPDASKLLQQGYNVTAIRPVITLSVGAGGEVTLKAKQAVVLLKGPSGYATVLVDVEQGKVLKIISVTRTVISKS